MKKIGALLLCVCLLCSAFSMVCFANDSEYWPAQKAYQNAIASGDDTAILNAVRQIEAAYPNPSNEVQYNRVAFPLQKAAMIYEEQTKYDDAVLYYRKFLKYIKWLDTNTGADYSFLLQSIPRVIEFLSVEPEVYAATSNQNSVPYFGAKYEPRLGTYFGTCNEFSEGEESAFLLYVSFGSESVESFDYRIPKTEKDYVLEIAWNLQKENLDGLKEVNSGRFDAYIERNAKYLSTLKGKVILRFGAEVNCWGDNTYHPNEMISQYKKAYVRVAKVIRKMAPNVALVYSPNTISNINVTAEDFYPGDKFVDWVGLSFYHNLSSESGYCVNSTDAFYGRGNYDDMMIKIKPIIDKFKNKKPIMISECGFAYSDPSGLQNSEHATRKIKEFYSYVNAVYPQVKLVLYFDVADAPNSGASYSLESNSTVFKAYKQSVEANAAMMSTLSDNGAVSYTVIDKFSEKTTSLDLKIYASFPLHKKTKVTVKVDGRQVISSAVAPFAFKIDTGKWEKGIHTIIVTAKSGSTNRTVIKCIEKSSSGMITCSGSLRDVPASHWAINYIDGCLQKKVFKGTSFVAFEPDAVMTRAMFVQVLANISGVDLSAYKKSSFNDVKGDSWYCKAVVWANRNGIVTGVGDGRFSPETNVTREQMCVMLSRYAKNRGIKMPRTSSAILFADQSKIGKWALADVQICQLAGLINGEKKGNKYYFDPQGGATRAQASKIFRIFSDF